MVLYLCENFVIEELYNVIGGYGMEGVIYGYAYTLLALAHTEGAGKLNLFTKVVVRNKLLKLLYHLARALDVAGASNTNCDFKHNVYLFRLFVADAGAHRLFYFSSGIALITDSQQH